MVFYYLSLVMYYYLEEIKQRKGVIATYDVFRVFNEKMSEFKNPINKVVTNHLITVQLLCNWEKEFQIMISNYTINNYNAVKVAEKGELYKISEVYIHNDFSLISLNEKGVRVNALNQLKFTEKMNLFNKKLYVNKKVKICI